MGAEAVDLGALIHLHGAPHHRIDIEGLHLH